MTTTIPDSSGCYHFTPQYQQFLGEIDQSHFTWATSGDSVAVFDLLEQTQGQKLSCYEIIRFIVKYIDIGDEYETVFREALLEAGYATR